MISARFRLSHILGKWTGLARTVGDMRSMGRAARVARPVLAGSRSDKTLHHVIYFTL